MNQAKGFWGSLFDFSFTDFITSKIIRILYVLLIIAAVVAALAAIVAGFTKSALLGVVTLLILGPLGFILAMICIRVYLEIILVIFRIAENTAEIARQKGKESSSNAF
ncbi:MAG: DUF4282 domain-containing protein [Calditrichaeota bacterium]|nr:DUF4282 domain-containing protein [Calditrichota bacterium]